MDKNTTTDADKIDMIKYFGKEIDIEDWKNINNIILEHEQQPIQFDILYFSERNRKGYLIRKNDLNKR